MLNFCHQKKTLIINYNHIIYEWGKNQKNKDDDENEEEKENWN